MNGIVAENGKVVTDEMIADWESALERDEWPSGWGGESMPEMLGRRRGAAIGDSPTALQISALVAAPVASQESLPLPTRIRQPKKFKTY